MKIILYVTFSVAFIGSCTLQTSTGLHCYGFDTAGAILLLGF